MYFMRLIYLAIETTPFLACHLKQLVIENQGNSHRQRSQSFHPELRENANKKK